MSSGATLREMEDGRIVFGHRYLQEIAEYLFFSEWTEALLRHYEKSYFTINLKVNHIRKNITKNKARHGD